VRRTALVAAAFTSAVAALVALVAAGVAPGPAAADLPLLLRSPGMLLLLATLVAVCWKTAVEHPLRSMALSAVALGWELPGLAAWPYPSARVSALLLAAAPLACAGAAALGASRRLSTGRRVGLVLAMLFTVADVAVQALGYDPFRDPGCRWTCQSAPAPLYGALSSRSALELAALLTLLAAVAATGALVDRRTAPASVRLGAVTGLALVTVAAVVRAAQWGNTSAAGTADVFQTLATVAIVAGVVAAALRTRAVRQAVREVVGQLAVGGAGTPTRALTTLGPVRSVEFAVPGTSEWVDQTGASVSASSSRPAAVVSDTKGPAVRLQLDARADPAAVVASLARSPATQLSLMNARLRAANLARVAAIRASQRRIVETTDRERKRIHRDLHDGAQQRLVAVAMQLSSAKQQAAPDAAGLLEVGDRHVRQALSALRSFSHGSMFEVLDTEGLMAALDDLASSMPLRVHLDVRVDHAQVSPASQTAVFDVVSAALAGVAAREAAGASSVPVTVVVAVEDNELTAQVSVDGDGPQWVESQLADAADRVGALGGSLALDSAAGRGMTLTARLPCAP
jgi:signal transduction histidine kinase